MPRKQRLKDEDGENVELPSGLLPSKRIARKPRKQRLKDEDEEEDDELPSGLLPSSRIAHTARKPRLKFARLRGCAGHRRRRAARL